MNIKQFYSTVNGNYEQALSIMMNDAFIGRMITKFYNNNSYNDIISAYEKKDYNSVFTSSHAFKGVAGNLSLTSLFEIASIITEATRNGANADIDDKIALLKERYQTFLDAYHKYVE